MRFIKSFSLLGLLLTTSAILPNSLQAELLLTSNGIHLGPGDNLSISIGINQTVIQENPVDIYFAVVPPASPTALFISGDIGTIVITPGAVNNPLTWTPLARSLQLNQGFDTGLIPFVDIPLGVGLETGDYIIALIATNTGTFNIVDSSTKTIRVLENSIKSNLGGFSGTWNNTTFGSSGGADLMITELSPGILQGTLNLDGFVGGLSDPDPETRQVELADLTGLIDYETEDPLINGSYSLTVTPDGEITIAVEDIGVGNFFSFNATGSRTGSTINLNYRVNSSMGTIATGTVTGEGQ